MKKSLITIAHVAVMLSLATGTSVAMALASKLPTELVNPTVDPVVCCGNSSPGQCNSCPRQ